VPAAQRKLNGFGNERDRRHLYDRRNGEIARDVSERALYGIPTDVDRIVISRRRADRGCRTARLVVVKMPMDRRRACGMIEVVNVYMREGRLIKAV
jgi:hypothetical protein